jgi:ribonuclease T1
MDSRRLKAALLAVVVAGLAAGGIAVSGGEDESTQATTPPAATAEDVSNSPLPSAEEQEIGRVLAAIESGDPLPHEEDGGVFQNREGLLPEQPLGYYREYTVATPGSPDRGARRLVIGEGGETYYTDDHYASFERIDPKVFR